MAKEKLVTIKQSNLTNNCPECFNQDLKLSFFQKHRYGKLSHRTTNEVTHQLVCNTCGSTIYPVKWTEDIGPLYRIYGRPTGIAYQLVGYLIGGSMRKLPVAVLLKKRQL